MVWGYYILYEDLEQREHIGAVSGVDRYVLVIDSVNVERWVMNRV